MILGEVKVEAETELNSAYQNLCKKDRNRVRYVICVGCNVSDAQFYEWLKRPELISSHADRYFIAVVLDKEIIQLFPKKS